ncbi:MAG: hypothetical protein V1735_00510 [Nanoarchaeota archaeon]
MSLPPELFSAVKDAEKIMVRTGIGTYYERCAEIMAALMGKGMNVILITFDVRVRELFDLLEKEKADVRAVCVIDCVSLLAGKGSAPIPKLINVYRPEYFVDIQIYTYLFLKKLKFANTFVFFLSMDKLEHYQSFDEVGMFLFVFDRFVRRHRVAQIVVEHDKIDFALRSIIANYADREIVI